MSRLTALFLSSLCFAIVGCAPILAQQDQSTAHAERTITADPSSNHPTKGIDDTDKAFLKDAAMGDQAEIGLGQMAQEKATDPDVKSFGQRMVKDHSTNDDQLKNVAAAVDVSLPTQLNQTLQSAKDELSRLSGSKFDHAYMLLMVQEHTKDVHKFKQEASSAENSTVKQFAQKSLPVLESHLKEVQQIEAKLKQK